MKLLNYRTKQWCLFSLIFVCN